MSEGTIGWHLAEALEFHGEAGIVRERGWTFPSDPHAVPRMTGAAAGHAFRAAELAYDGGSSMAINPNVTMEMVENAYDE